MRQSPQIVGEDAQARQKTIRKPLQRLQQGKVNDYTKVAQTDPIFLSRQMDWVLATQRWQCAVYSEGRAKETLYENWTYIKWLLILNQVREWRHSQRVAVCWQCRHLTTKCDHEAQQVCQRNGFSWIEQPWEKTSSLSNDSQNFHHFLHNNLTRRLGVYTTSRYTPDSRSHKAQSHWAALGRRSVKHASQKDRASGQQGHIDPSLINTFREDSGPVWQLFVFLLPTVLSLTNKCYRSLCRISRQFVTFIWRGISYGRETIHFYALPSLFFRIRWKQSVQRSTTSQTLGHQELF